MDADLEKFKGVYPALVTPYDRKGRVDEEVLRSLVDWHLEAGVRGFFVCGTTGEGLLLTTEERRRVAEVVAEHLDGRGVCIVHVGHPSSEESARLARHAQEVGADAVSSIPPIYYRVGLEGVLLHYRTIAEATSLPLFVYNIPVTTGVRITAEDMGYIFRIPSVVGMKYTDADYYEMRNILDLADREVLVLSGRDELFLPALTMGAEGSIGTTQNIFPELFVGIYEAFSGGNWKRAMELQLKASRAIRILLHGGLDAWKAVLRFKGFPVGHPRPPLKAISSDEEEKIVQELSSLGLL